MTYIMTRRLLSGVSLAALMLGTTQGAALAADCSASSPAISADCTNYANPGTLATFSNTVTISAPAGAGEAHAFENTGGIGTIDNQGTISAVNDSRNNSYGLYNAGTISTIDNSGVISGTIDNAVAFFGQQTTSGIWNTVDGSIGTIVNDGTISGGQTGDPYYNFNIYGIRNEGTIAKITNNGDILGKYGIYSDASNNPAATISELYNYGNISGVRISLGEEGVVETIDNEGSITAATAKMGLAALDLEGGTINEITNGGTIEGADKMGILGWDATIGTIGNTGTISGFVGIGLYSVFGKASVETLNNGAGGTITGEQAGIMAFAASIGLLTNDGDISGTGDTPLLAQISGSLGVTLPGSLGDLNGNGAIVSILSDIGTLQNNGTLSSTSAGTAAALLGIGSTFDTIANAQGATMSATGNLVLGAGLIGGSATAITNDGEIAATGTGDGSTAVGIMAMGSKVLGIDGPAVDVTAITNTGSITASGDIALGGLLGLASVGSFDNSGILSADGAILGGGLLIASSDIGSFTNSGTIEGSGPYSGGVAVIGLDAMAQNLGDADLTGPLGGSGNPLLAALAALDEATLATPAHIDTFVNSGTISGGLLGLYLGGGATVGSFENSGILKSGSVALYVDEGAAIGDIANSGTISGPDAMMFYRDSSFGTITNDGTIAGTIKNRTDDNLIFIGGSGDTFGLITGYSAVPGTLVTGLIENQNADVNFLSGSMILNSDIDVGTHTVNNGGTLQIGGTISITGNYVQSSSGKLIIAASSASIGQLLVSGTANLTNGTIVIVPIGGYLFAGGTATVLSAGSFAIDGLTINVGTETETFTTETNGGVTHLVSNLPDAGTGGAGYAEIGAAAGKVGGEMGRALDVIAGGSSSEAIAFQSTALVTLLGLDDADQPAAIAQLAPSADTPDWQIGLSANGIFSDAVGQRQTERMRSFGATDVAETSGLSGTGQFWGQVLGGRAKGSGYGIDGGGLAIGTDVVLSDRFLFGIAGSWLSLNANPDAEVATGSTQQLYQGRLYGTWRPGAFFVDAQAGFGLSRSDQSRDIAFLGDVAKAQFDGRTATLRTEAGYDLPLSAGPKRVLVATPIVGFDFTRVANDRYTETGAGAAGLTVDKQTVNNVSSTIGARLMWSVPTVLGRLTPEVRADWVHDYISDPVVTNGTLAGAHFAVATDRLAEDGADLGLSLTAQSGSLLLSAEYDGQFRSGYESHTGRLKAALRF